MYLHALFIQLSCNAHAKRVQCTCTCSTSAMQIGTLSSSAASEHSTISESSPTLSDQPRRVLFPSLTIQVGSSTIAETPSRQLCSSLRSSATCKWMQGGGRERKVLQLACAVRIPRAIYKLATLGVQALTPCVQGSCNPMHPGHTSRSTRSRFCGATDCSTVCIMKQHDFTWDAKRDAASDTQGYSLGA